MRGKQSFVGTGTPRGRIREDKLLSGIQVIPNLCTVRCKVMQHQKLVCSLGQAQANILDSSLIKNSSQLHPCQRGSIYFFVVESCTNQNVQGTGLPRSEPPSPAHSTHVVKGKTSIEHKSHRHIRVNNHRDRHFTPVSGKTTVSPLTCFKEDAQWDGNLPCWYIEEAVWTVSPLRASQLKPNANCQIPGFPREVMRKQAMHRQGGMEPGQLPLPAFFFKHSRSSDEALSVIWKHLQLRSKRCLLHMQNRGTKPKQAKHRTKHNQTKHKKTKHTQPTQQEAAHAVGKVKKVKR